MTFYPWTHDRTKLTQNKTRKILPGSKIVVMGFCVLIRLLVLFLRINIFLILGRYLTKKLTKKKGELKNL